MTNILNRNIKPVKPTKSRPANSYLLKPTSAVRAMRTHHHLKQNLLKTAKDGVILIGLLFGLLHAYNWLSDQAEIKQAEKRVSEAKAEQAKVELAWIGCLNHKGVFVDGTLHTCNLANTHIKIGVNL